jgi:type II secretory pathway pseudopilin PulG
LKRHAQGASLIFVVIVILGLIAIVAVFSQLFRGTSTAASSSQTARGLAAAADALEQFASAAGRLPCPAKPNVDFNADTGEEDPTPPLPSGACNSAAGAIPWKAIGLRREDASDSWGTKISYRVYMGANGSLTQPQGASMLKCDLVEPPPLKGRTPVTGNAAAGYVGGLCRDTYDTLPDEFFGTGLQKKGLSVRDFGTVVDGVAYVLISHGPSGLGGFTVAGVARAAPGNAGEIANTTATGPFVVQTAMTSGLSPDAAAFFDDVLVYRKLDDFVQRAKLGAREWPELTVPSNVVLNAATVGAAVGTSVSFGDNLRETSIDLGTARVSGFRSGNRTTNLSFDEGANGSTGDGIGGIGINRTSTLISSSGGEFVRIDFNTKAAKLGITLNHFGTYTSGGRVYTENVQFTFYNGGTQVGSPVVKAGCNPDGGLASYSLDVPGAIYDSVDVTPISATASGGFASASALLISAFAACGAGPGLCNTALQASYPQSSCP